MVESSDPEGYRAMQATLAMLSDRVENLQAMADDKGRQLQVSDVIGPEGYRAMQATLAMLSDRVENLQAMADDKGRQLQVSKESS